MADLDSFCENCKWFKDLGNGKTGKCIRYPPVAHPMGDDGKQAVSMWPDVQLKQLCGEWAPGTLQ